MDEGEERLGTLSDGSNQVMVEDVLDWTEQAVEVMEQIMKSEKPNH